ncbi:MAG: DUF2029 domain-containing protein [Planctomycetes bacterium]|nr:DUF2029 domain-containing protein [Planctomycetota bacterium]
MMTSRAAFGSLKSWERAVAAVLIAIPIVFGIVVLVRSSFLDTRRTDVGCYLRAGWAVRAGVDPYAVTDDNGWHFAYPPVAALLFVPLADAPADADRAGMLPYPLSVVIWYLINAACILLATHWIASTLEEHSVDPALRAMPAGCRRWWFVRVFPLLLCLVQIGSTLSRGQVTPLLILCVAGMFRATVKGRSWRSGLWLAAAICVKLIPAFLVLFPLWRRDRRALAGVTLGVLAGFVIIPSLVWGVPGALEMHERMLRGIILPAMSEAGDQTRARELTNINGTDHQSIGAILHNYQYWGNLANRPAQPDPWVRIAHWAIGGLLTLLTLVAAGWKRDDDPIRMLLFLGALFVLMIVISPLSHLHYFAKALPLVMGLHAAGLGPRPALMPSWAISAALVLTCAAYAMPTVHTGWQARREAGLPLMASLILCGFALWRLQKAKAAAFGETVTRNWRRAA